MFGVWVEFEIDVAHRDDFVARVRQQASDSLALEADCQVFDVCLADDAPATVLLYELYTDAAAFDVHLASPHFKAFDTAVSGWVVRKSVRRFSRI